MKSYCITSTGERVAIPQEELDAMQAIQDAESTANVLPNIISQRRGRYAAESDPLFHEWQYTQDPADDAKWRAKVLEIKTDLPLPV